MSKKEEITLKTRPKTPNICRICSACDKNIDWFNKFEEKIKKFTTLQGLKEAGIKTQIMKPWKPKGMLVTAININEFYKFLLKEVLGVWCC